jgi:hypothetical protein
VAADESSNAAGGIKNEAKKKAPKKQVAHPSNTARPIDFAADAAPCVTRMTDIVPTAIHEDSAPPVLTKGQGGKANFPNSRAGLITTQEDREFVSSLLTEVLIEYQKPPVRSDEELQERLNDYFMRCGRTGQVPTVEEMCMSTGWTMDYVNEWVSGRRGGVGDSSGAIVKKAKEFLKTFDAKLVVSGKLNFLAYCFRAKNYYGMSDKTEHVITDTTRSETDYSAEDIAKRYSVDYSEVIEVEPLD